MCYNVTKNIVKYIQLFIIYPETLYQGLILDLDVTSYANRQFAPCYMKKIKDELFIEQYIKGNYFAKKYGKYLGKDYGKVKK